MIIGIPVKKLNDKWVVSSKFGKARFFAILDNQTIQIVEADTQNGKDAINFLKSYKVKVVITSHIGIKALDYLNENQMNIYFVEKHTPLDKAIEMYKEGKLKSLKDDLNYKKDKDGKLILTYK